MKGKEFDTRKAPITFIDLEMTGLEAHKHEIVEIGIVKASFPELEIIDTWKAKIKPVHLETQDPEALKISGYNEEAWKNALSLKEMMVTLAEKSKGSLLAGFVPFADYSFLDKAVSDTGIPLDFHRRTLDVHSWAVALLGYEWNDSGLSSMCQKLGIKLENHHTAMADAMATYELYKLVSRKTRR